MSEKLEFTSLVWDNNLLTEKERGNLLLTYRVLSASSFYFILTTNHTSKMLNDLNDFQNTRGASPKKFNVDNKFGTDVCVYLASIFPNIYTLGMSSYSVHLLHYLFNQRPEILCDRFFYPMENAPNEYPGQSKKNFSANRSKLGSTFGTPRQRLNSYGHNLPLTDFEVLSFTLQYELDYPNVLYFLSQIDAPLSQIKEPFLT